MIGKTLYSVNDICQPAKAFEVMQELQGKLMIPNLLTTNTKILMSFAQTCRSFKIYLTVRVWWCNMISAPQERKSLWSYARAAREIDDTKLVDYKCIFTNREFVWYLREKTHFHINQAFVFYFCTMFTFDVGLYWNFACKCCYCIFTWRLLSTSKAFAGWQISLTEYSVFPIITVGTLFFTLINLTN
jgi:hypothetical protein